MNLQELLLGGGIGVVGLLTLVQIAPVRVNPWSWLLKRLGRAINAEVLDSEHMGPNASGRADKDLKAPLALLSKVWLSLTYLVLKPLMLLRPSMLYLLLFVPLV